MAKGKKSGKRLRSTREQVLVLLARDKKVYNRKTKSYEREPVTMVETARELRVSVSTLRRWKNKGVSPRSDSVARRLRAKSSSVASSFSRAVSRDRKKHRGSLDVRKLKIPYIPEAHRRRLKRYAKDKSGRVRATGQEYESPIINYNVRGWNFAEIGALLIAIWKARRPFQFVYEVPAGGQLPASGQFKARRVTTTTRVSTAPINPHWFTDEAELLTLLNRYIEMETGPLARRIVYVSVDDGKAKSTRRPSGY